MDARERRETYNGASNAWARAVDLTVTPGIFGFLGYRFDLWAGTSPLFTIVLFAVCLTYVVWKAYMAYEAEMRAHEARLLAGRGQRGGREPAGAA